MSSSAPTTCIPADDQAFQEVLGHGRHPKNPERMNALIRAEHEDDDQLPPLLVEDASDADNGNFTGDDSGSSSESSSLGSDGDIQEITNVELATILPMKTVPQRGGNDINSQASKHAWVEEVEDEDSGSLQPLTSLAPPKLTKASKRNLIYYFYKVVEMNSDGQAGNVGDKHYKCYLGNCKVLMIMHAMKSSLNGEKVLDATSAAQYLVQLEQSSVNIVNAFNKQVTKAFGDWNQARFEELLAQWLITCDQLFEEVE
ncbi:hypothetical protein EDD22DRAFT_953471 [Suillus occidentalis]|nr:hypothetical protein EDD22DRAFT_953471 [Suillus occidentalis]